MKKINLFTAFLKKADFVRIGVILVIGALSEPLIAYSYTFLSDFIADRSNGGSLSGLTGCAVLVLIALLMAAANYIYKGYIANEANTKLKKKLFFSILNKPVPEFQKKDSGTYMNTVTRRADIWQYQYFNNILQCFEQVLEIAAILFLLARIHRAAFVTMLLFLLPLVVNNIFFPRFIRRHYGDYMKNEDAVTVKMKEFFLGFESIKLISGENAFSQRMDSFFDRSQKSRQWVDFLNNLSACFANLGVTVSKFSGVVIGVLLLNRGEISFGNFLTIFQLSAVLNEPVVRLVNATVGLQSVRKINEELRGELAFARAPSAGTPEAVESLPAKVENISLENVRFRYANREKPLFDGLNFTFERGKKYLIVGESGCGKSTLVKLLLGQIPNYEGTVQYGDTDLHRIKLESLYARVSYTPQNVFIFDGSVRDNIDLLRCRSDEQVKKAAEAAQLSSFLASREEGLQSVINEEVLKVSGGERSRIGLARALISGRDVLILDEILSALDTKNSYEIEKDILGIQDKTVLHIAHRSNPELLNRYDCILMLKDGRLVPSSPVPERAKAAN